MLLTLKPKHIALASSKANFPPGVAMLRDPEAILRQCASLLDGLDFETSVKRRKSRFSTTAFGHVWWGSNWEKKSKHQQAKVAVHETTHAIQERKRFLFEILIYPRPRKLWIYEVQAYGSGLRAMKQMGYSELEIRAEAERNAESIWDHYLPAKLIRKKSFDQQTVATLLSHVGLEP